MNKWYFTACTAFCALVFSPGARAQVQGSEAPDTKVIIIEERVDQHGHKTITRTVREGNFTDEEIEDMIADPGTSRPITNGGKGYLGVMIDNVDQGVRITEVIEASPAETAGLRPGDIITDVNGIATTSIESLVHEISSHQPGDQVTLHYLRDDSPQSMQVILTERTPSVDDVFGWDEDVERMEENARQEHEIQMREHEKMMEEHHARMEEHEQDLRKHEQALEEHAREMERAERLGENTRPRFGVFLDEVEAGPGVRVSRVSEGSLAEVTGLRQGDVITRFNGAEINSSEDLIKAVKAAPGGKKIKLEYLRAGKKYKDRVEFPES